MSDNNNNPSAPMSSPSVSVTGSAQPASLAQQASTMPAASVTATAAAAAAAVNSPPLDGTGEVMRCQWAGCTETFPTAETLYDHLCERHVGRKSTNNLNLTCQWGTCNVTTVKRDHITSHLRVHVPLKPHKCRTCAKTFKRPQDLKKHVKTHADDSEIRSPEPGTKQVDMMYPGHPKGYTAAHYFEGPMNAVPTQGYPHGAPQYYQPPPQPANPHSYGNVLYTMSQGQDGNHTYDQKREYHALNEFFGDVKRGQFDPNSLAAVGQRLVGLQALHLPMLNGPVPDYQPMSASVAVGGGAYSSGGSNAPAYHLPPMSNVRTKNDLINVDRILEQMQNTFYESDEHVAAAGVAQPGAHYVQGGMSHQTAHSPPAQLPSGHVTATTSAGTMMTATSAHSPSTGTPAVTPPSSAQSYTSNRSPTIAAQTHRVSPPHESGASMYPRLPSTTASDSMTARYPTAFSAAPPSTLSGVYHHDDRRRYTGGTLQRARPADGDAAADLMDTSHEKDDGDRTPPAKQRGYISESVIDPALQSSTSSDPDQEAAQRTAQAATEVADRADDVDWVEKVRLLEHLRLLVNQKLESGDYEEESAYPNLDGGMDVESASARSGEEKPAKAEGGESVEYPTLRGVEDGDAKMSVDSE